MSFYRSPIYLKSQIKYRRLVLAVCILKLWNITPASLTQNCPLMHVKVIKMNNMCLVRWYPQLGSKRKIPKTHV